MIRGLVLLAGLLAPFPLMADLYRWVERESGSVKFSSTPPPWYGDPEKERTAPPVEVIRYRGAAAQAKPAPAKPASTPAIAALEARWAELMKLFATLPPSTDFARAGTGIRQQVEAYQALSAELDRLDPAGAARRRAQEPGVLDTIRKGLEAQLSAKPPVQ